MDYLAIAQKAKTEFRKAQGRNPQAAEYGDITEGRIVAALIDSPIVGPLWFALDEGFQSGDDIAIFYANELPHLRKMTAEELRRRYAEKLALGGGWIRDRIG